MSWEMGAVVGVLWLGVLWLGMLWLGGGWGELELELEGERLSCAGLG